MNFGAAIKSAFSNYAVFEGRATRPEYWWFFLFSALVNLAFEVAAGPRDNPNLLIAMASLAFSLAILVPSIAVAARRLHDTERSGWWQLIALTGIGIFILLFWFAQNGTDGPNRFGPEPPAAPSGD